MQKIQDIREKRIEDKSWKTKQTFAPCFSLANNKQPNNTALAVKRNPEKKSAQFGERFRNKSGMTATIKNGNEENNIQEKMNDECRILNNECRREKNEENAESLLERSPLMRGDAGGRGVKKKNNTQYSINNIQFISEEKQAEDRKQKAEVLSAKFKVQGSKFRVRSEETLLERHPELDSGSYATTTVVFIDRFRVEPRMTGKENIQYSINNIQCRSGKKMAELILNSADICLERHPELDSGSPATNKRFRFEPGMTATIKNGNEENNIQEKMNNECRMMNNEFRSKKENEENVACPDERRISVNLILCLH